MNIGFIGLGLMGRPMALNLVKAGHAVRVWARRAESMAPLLAAGAGAAASAADAAADADLVISMVADSPDVEEVMLGPAGAAHGLGKARPGCVFVDMSTIAPSTARSIAVRLHEKGIDFLDAPVSGGEVGAIAGTLSIMAGGVETAFAKALPAFEAMGRNIVHIGESGAGQVAKACNQIIVSLSTLAVAEALSFARKAGVDAGKVREALLGGFAASRILELHGARMLKRDFKPGFKAWMLQKDLNIVTRTAYENQLALPGTALAAQLYNGMSACGLGEEDSLAIVRLVEMLAGLEDPPGGD